jgi:hypothetical protein
VAKPSAHRILFDLSDEASAMRLPRFRIRTFMIAVAAAGVLLALLES